MVGLIALAGIAPWTPAGAQSLVSTGESFITADLAFGTSGPERREMGLVLDIAPGWKTYWRNPGEAGIPPRFDWSDSENVAAVEIAWPRPEIFESFGLTTLGYSGRVVLPITVTPADPGADLVLNGELQIGVCNEICVIEAASVAELAPVEGFGPEQSLITEWRARVPGDGATLGVTLAECRIAGQGEDRSFEALLTSGRDLSGAHVVLEGPDETWFHGTETQAAPDGLAVSSTLSLFDANGWVGRSDVRITILSGHDAAEIQGCSAPAG